MKSAPAQRRTSDETVGFLSTLSAYLLWGVLPVYFLILAPTGAWETVAWRIVFSVVFCLVALAVTRGWSRVIAVFRDPKLAALTALGGGLVYINWQLFVLAAQGGQVVESSLGYFINPIVSVLLGVLVLHERLRPLQWTAIGVAALAVIAIVIGYGEMPWISLGLAFSFGFYGLVKNRIGPRVDAVSGLTLETVWLLPVAIVQLVVVAVTSGITIGVGGIGHVALIAGLGITTAVPLLLFAIGTRRIPLTMVGILQFAAPILQFLVGVFILHEPMPAERWIGFGIVWVAVVILVTDSLLAGRRARAALARAAQV
ncbi:EamA family transporter RarD [Microbacterium nymphoidis]|uniref:EamA family transporter RarD n=1 Tax=Microbacterium nymphoidis TaxID=2898586 RepID=UPI001E3CED73|nr:EamA family transporter RarD [Microbacterium nymphoidis]MCD2497761.1 EamA family transporter RarD [Microbacterium nymphoidis]